MINDTHRAGREVEALDHYLADLRRDLAAPQPPELDLELATVAREIVASELVGPLPAEAVQARIWQQALASAHTERHRPRRRRTGLRLWTRAHPILLRATSIAAVIVLTLSAVLWASPGVRARTGQLACLVPGLGIRDCDIASLVAAEPVAQARNGVTLTVLAVLSSGNTTIVRVELTGLPMPAAGTPSPVGQLRLALHDAAGRAYDRTMMPAQGMVPTGSTLSLTLSIEGTYAALDPAVRAVDVLLDGPAPVGSWQVRVPVVPVQEATLPAAQRGGAGTTLHGVTVRVASVAADKRGLAVQLVAQTDTPERIVRDDIGGARYNRRLTLRDDQGREWTELPTFNNNQRSTDPAVVIDEADFPSMPPGLTRATLSIPFVTVEEVGATATLHVPLAGRKVGDQFTISGDLSFGGFPVRVVNVTLAEDNKGNRRLWLDMDLGDWVEGRKLVRPGLWGLDGDKFPYCGSYGRGDVLQQYRFCVALPPDYGDDVTVTIANPVVAIRGPWEVEVPIPAKR